VIALPIKAALRRESAAGYVEITHVFALGKPLVRDGEIIVTEKFLARSNRRISLYGGKT